MDAAVFLSQLEELFEVDSGTLELSTALEDIPAWGSLSFLGLMAMVDDEYQVTLPPKKVLACQTLQDLMREISSLIPAEKRAA